MVRISIGETPFRMTYRSEAVVPVEVGLTTFRTSIYDDQQNEGQIRLNLDLIDEFQEKAETRMKRYQQNMARHYNTKLSQGNFPSAISSYDKLPWPPKISLKES
jgi:hypothetical protein